MTDALATYPPLNTLKPVAEDIWIVDGPIIKFGPLWPKLSFPTRMTVFRLRGDALLVHSPTRLIPQLRVEIERVGRPRWIVGPNRIPCWWIPDWHAGFPTAQVFIPPETSRQARNRVNFDCPILSRDCGYPWDEEIATLPVSGSYMTEIELFHRATRTLVLTDLIENFEPE